MGYDLQGLEGLLSNSFISYRLATNYESPFVALISCFPTQLLPAPHRPAPGSLLATGSRHSRTPYFFLKKSARSPSWLGVGSTSVARIAACCRAHSSRIPFFPRVSREANSTSVKVLSSPAPWI